MEFYSAQFVSQPSGRFQLADLSPLSTQPTQYSVVDPVTLDISIPVVRSDDAAYMVALTRLGPLEWGVTEIMVRPRVDDALIRAVDLELPAQGAPTSLLRTYSPAMNYSGPLGPRWTHSYLKHVRVRPDGDVDLFNVDGSESRFRDLGGGSYQHPPGEFRQLRRQPDGSLEVTEADGRNFLFDPSGRLVEILDSLNHRTQLSYGANQQLASVVDPSGQIMLFFYDSTGRLISVQDGAGRQSSYSYDALGHLVSATTVTGGTVSYRYDSRGVLAERTDAASRSTGYVVDEYFITTAIQRPGTTSPIAFRYGSPSFDRLKIVHPDGTQVRLRMDSSGRVTSWTDPLGNVTQHTYDSHGNLTSTIDPDGNQTGFAYDGRGNVVSSTDAQGNVTTYCYEPEHNVLTCVADANGSTTYFSHDAQGNLVLVSHPDGTAESYTYDATGNRLSSVDRMGRSISYSYDSRGLLTRKTFPDGSNHGYHYDGFGFLNSMSDAAGQTTTFQRDSAGRVLQVDLPTGESIQATYAASGERTSLTYPHGLRLDYRYSPQGELERIESGGSVLATYSYDSLGRPVRRLLESGLDTQYEYDLAGQLSEIEHLRPDLSIISSFSYSYDPRGNALTKTSLAGTTHYAYDSLSRLISETAPSGFQTSYSYDALGNRMLAADVSYVANSLNQYTSVDGDPVSYDANGNLTQRLTARGLTIYQYDFENRLTQTTNSLGTVTYAYDPLGRRISKTSAAGSIRYLHDGWDVIQERDDTGSILASYVHGLRIDEVLGMQRNGEVYYFCHDRLGSITEVLDDSLNLVESTTYDAFGIPSAPSSVGNPFLFTGRAYEPESGLYYYRARYYDPHLGRFLSPDPLRFIDGPNVYSYVLNNPTNLVDPLGLRSGWGWASWGLGGALHLAGAFFVGSNPVAAGLWAASYLWWAVGYDSPVWDPLKDGGGGQCPTFIQIPLGVQLPAGRIELSVGDEPLAAKITVPVGGVLMRSDIPIFGVAGGRNFKSYRVEFGDGPDPQEWTEIESSSEPQNSTSVGMTDIPLMIGDMDLRGNLATWNTGLKNWVHLPWHPASDPTDFNGIYTIRLLVEGMDGEQVEDRFTATVGRVIAQCLPGLARSPDGRVTLQFPEQALMQAFRVYSILPVTVDLPAPEGVLLSEIYEIREPGEQWIKSAQLSFEVGQAAGDEEDPDAVAICYFDFDSGRWRALSCARSRDERGALVTGSLSQLASSRALYALVRHHDFHSPEKERVASGAERLDLEGARSGETLVFNSFEVGLGQWTSRDLHVGASLSLEPRDPGGTCCRLTNVDSPSNFSATILSSPFDVRDFERMTFDYRIQPGASLDFHILVAGRWYCLEFASPSAAFQNQDVNIVNLGRVDGVVADGNWHTASVDLHRLLREITRHTCVDEIVLADWDVGGYMKLEFGKNEVGTSIWFDNFRITGVAERRHAEELIVSTFDDSQGNYLLQQPAGVFSNPGTEYCVARVSAEAGAIEENQVLHLDFDVSRPDSFAGYWLALMASDLGDMQELSFRVRSAERLPPFAVGLKHAATGVEALVPAFSYAASAASDGWQELTIPLSAFVARGLPDLNLMETVFFMFRDRDGSGFGRIEVDDILFRRHSSYGRVLPIPPGSDGRNLLGGESRILANGAGAISANSRDRASGDPRGLERATRISFGGTIGLDLREDGFSYATWETDLPGFDASRFDYLVLQVRGHKGGELPNVYLNDGSVRRPVVAADLAAISTQWAEMRVPLQSWREQGVDLTHLESLQIAFEWQEMSGTIYLGEIRFERQDQRLAIVGSQP
jgi:RHS repeat-associated protein